MLESTSPKSFKRIKRKPLQLGTEHAIWTLPSSHDNELPLLVQPEIPDLNLPVWAAKHQVSVQRALLKHGGLLFRDTNIKTAAEFERFISAISGALLPYDYRSTPRRQVEGMIYTSTEYPADQAIPLHNEMSYSRAWPMKIYFYCTHPATHGGETPLANSRKIFRRIAPEITEQFISRKVMYVRNYGERVDLSWRDVFQTNDKAAVESYCRRAGIEAEWSSGTLHTRQICPAVADHPYTGETVWFNQAHLFHVSNLPPSIQESLVSICPDGLPRNAFYGDGAPIENSVLEEIRAAYLRETVTFRWQAGDILLLDNMLTAHGRFPFTGPREVLVGMAEAYPGKDA